jgi:iron complex outermembrane receptor protein
MRIPLSHSLVAFLCATPAFAAEGNQSSATDSKLDTVTVTGARIGTSLETSTSAGAMGSKKLLDTPFSITVVDDEEISRRQINSVAQLFINDSSIFSSAPSATTSWWALRIRGLGVRNYYVDGVPFMMSWGGELPLEPMARVDALKGLTGFMYGFGAPGGAINYQIKKPTDQTMAVGAVEYRSERLLTGHIDAGGRAGATDQFGYRVNVAAESGEAYNSADVDRNIASLALDYRLTSELQWFANAIYEDSSLDNEPLHFYLDAFTGDHLPTPTHDYEDITVRNSYYKTETLIGSTGLNWNVSEDWSSNLTVGYALQDHRSNRVFADLLNEEGDYDGSIYNFAQRMEFFITQALVQGTISTGAIRHELVFGASHEREVTQPSAVYRFENTFDGNIYRQQTHSVDRTHPGLASFKRDDRQTAAFASDTLHFGAHWQALLGLRYTDYEAVDRDGNPAVDSSYQTDALSPTYAVIFKPTQQMSIYGSFVESMEKGSRVGATYANAGELLGASVSRQFELGAKLQLQRFSFTTAAFRVQQAAQIDQIRSGLRYRTQDGLNLFDGIEAIGNFNVTPNLTIGLGATHLDASIDRVSPQNQNLRGKVPAGASDWELVASADYRVPRLAGLSLFGNIRYFGDAYYDSLNQAEIPHRTVISTGLQYQTEIAGRRTVFTGSINNLLNEPYWELNSIGENRNAALAMRVHW